MCRQSGSRWNCGVGWLCWVLSLCGFEISAGELVPLPVEQPVRASASAAAARRPWDLFMMISGGCMASG
jgi:hypothetical protein